MNKKIIFRISLVLNVILIIALIILALFFKEVIISKKTNLTSKVQITTPKVIYHQPKPLKLVWMTDEEKGSFNVAVTNKIQVLARDKDGKIIAYRLIHKPSDIVTKY